MKTGALLITAAALAATLGGLGCAGAPPVTVKAKGVTVSTDAPPPPPGPPQKIVVQGLNLEGAQLSGIPDIEFDTAQSTIKKTPGNSATLQLLVLGSQQNRNITLLRVEGHTDSDGDSANNQHLSELRAQAVVDFLVKAGVDGGRLRAVGCAAKDPLFPNDTAEHKARNRRTEFDIETIDGQRPEGYTDACLPNQFRKH
jgi:OOP family OmpA-OmpF porin